MKKMEEKKKQKPDEMCMGSWGIFSPSSSEILNTSQIVKPQRPVRSDATTQHKPVEISLPVFN